MRRSRGVEPSRPGPERLAEWGMRAFDKWGFRDSGPRSGLGLTPVRSRGPGISLFVAEQASKRFWTLWVRLKSIASTEAPAISARRDSTKGID